MYEAEVHKLQGAKITLESQALALESATGNIEVLKAMKEGANAMSRVRGNMYKRCIIVPFCSIPHLSRLNAVMPQPLMTLWMKSTRKKILRSKSRKQFQGLLRICLKMCVPDTLPAFICLMYFYLG